MTKKMLFLGLAVLLVASIGYVFAQDTSNQSNQPSQQLSTDKNMPGMSHDQSGTSVTGVVDKIDKDKKTLTIKDEATGQKKTLSFNDTTTWMNGTNSGTIDDLKKGSRVTFTVDQYNMISRGEISSAGSTTTPSSTSQTPPQPH